MTGAGTGRKRIIAGAALPLPFEGLAALPRPRRQLPAGPPRRHGADDPVPHEAQRCHQGEEGHEEKHKGPVIIEAGAVPEGEETDGQAL
jgi:hypothetical protein